MTPRVSIVMPCYNASGHLVRSVASVQAQTMGDWELVAVDDGSRDDTWTQLVQLAQADPRIRPLQQANTGAGPARNRGLQAASGEYVAFLDSDDTWHPRCLDSLLQALQADPRARIAYCGWQNIGLGGGRDAPYVPPDYEAGDKLESLLRSCPWPIHAALCRLQDVLDAGGFDPELTSCMDYDLWLRLGSVHTLVRVPHVLAHYHHHGSGQITSNRARIALNHLRVQRKFLTSRPDVAQRLGRERVRELTYGELLKRGYIAYWQRDLDSARIIFRHTMTHGYGSVRDWLYMLPSWLPERWHRAFLMARDRTTPASDEPTSH